MAATASSQQTSLSLKTAHRSVWTVKRAKKSQGRNHHLLFALPRSLEPRTRTYLSSVADHRFEAVLVIKVPPLYHSIFPTKRKTGKESYREDSLNSQGCEYLICCFRIIQRKCWKPVYLIALGSGESQLSLWLLFHENKELPPTHSSDCAPQHTPHLPSSHLAYSAGAL